MGSARVEKQFASSASSRRNDASNGKSQDALSSVFVISRVCRELQHAINNCVRRSHQFVMRTSPMSNARCALTCVPSVKNRSAPW